MKTLRLLPMLLLSVGSLCAATLTWTHDSIGQPLTVTVPNPKGGSPLVITNLPVTFYVYRSLNLTNWTIIATVPGTNRVTVPTPTTKAFFAVTASNSYAGETFFSSVAVADEITIARETKITKQ